ncbi:chemotaxis protein CheW [Longibaculum muris]|uniref:chemotaxis protein CheW n=1 Tax=Longibaculum muris TaxID=1796628 RepID=UPI0022E48195|nr:chemotaxis protein CheW [Longibaculum muris]
MSYYVVVESSQVLFLLPLTIVDMIVDCDSLEDQKVIDLSSLFHNEQTQGSYAILIKDQQLALVVDKVEDVLEVSQEKIIPFNHVVLKKKIPFVQGVISHHEQLCFVLLESVLDVLIKNKDG